MSEDKRPTISMGPIVMDCGVDQAEILSLFYSKLLGWKLSYWHFRKQKHMNLLFGHGKPERTVKCCILI